MKNMNNKTKKWLVVAGGLAVSAVLVALIAGQFKNPPITDVDIPDSNSQNQNIVVETPNITEKENNIKVPDIEIPEQNTSSKGDDKGTDQTIQGDVPEKPNYTEEQLTNPEQKPSGEKVDPPTKKNPNPPQTQDKPKDKPSTNTGGGLPGFDNVPNMGENKGTIVDGDGDVNKQVGTMD